MRCRFPCLRPVTGRDDEAANGGVLAAARKILACLFPDESALFADVSGVFPNESTLLSYFSGAFLKRPAGQASSISGVFPGIFPNEPMLFSYFSGIFPNESTRLSEVSGLFPGPALMSRSRPKFPKSFQLSKSLASGEDR